MESRLERRVEEVELRGVDIFGLFVCWLLVVVVVVVEKADEKAEMILVVVVLV
jgi:hypothetical protein